MADIHSTNSNYVRYTLFSEIISPLIVKEPTGWKDDDIEINRHEDYHGIFFDFTGSLGFSNDAKEYILHVYNTLGVNARLLLVKEKLREVEGVVKYETEYFGFADFMTMIVTEKDIKINFNSFDLLQVLKSHEEDDFELERITDINGNSIETLTPETTTLQGRTLGGTNEHKIDPITVIGEIPSDNPAGSARYDQVAAVTPLTILLNDSGYTRNASVDFWKADDYQDLAAGNMFYTALENDPQGETSYLTFSFDVDWYFGGLLGSKKLWFDVIKYKWDPGAAEYSIGEILYQKEYNDSHVLQSLNEEINDPIIVECAWDEGLALRVHVEDNEKMDFYFTKVQITVQEKSTYVPTQDVQFLFNHDIGQRLAYIITGQKDAFYSKIFGRKGNGYELTGQRGLVGSTSGLWVRSFDVESQKYKSYTTNFKKWYESNKAVFNIGLGIDNVDSQERIRIEDLKFFYQDRAIIRLKNQVTNVTRRLDERLFFSGVELGYKYGGDYSDEMGLDEPNTQSNWVTPINKSELKYKKTSEVRADDYGMEITRRKPQALYPDEDTQRDESNWWLDMVETAQGGYTQATYEDRMAENYVPKNIYDPATFYGMIFTPQQMLLRHGWVIRSGLEKYQDKFITYGSSKANDKLKMQFPHEPELQQNDDIQVAYLERSRVSPWIIEFDHAVDDALMDELLGYTEINYEGSLERVRNFYFQIEFLNEYGQYERAYIKSVQPSGQGRWVCNLANSELIGDIIEPLPIQTMTCDLTKDSCSEGVVVFPDTVYFRSNEIEPVIGDVIFSDPDADEPYFNMNTMSSIGGLKTDSTGRMVAISCGLMKEFKANRFVDKCTQGTTEFPDSFFTRSSLAYPEKGEVIYLDINGTAVAANRQGVMANGKGFETDENGISIKFNC
jgi:hypothetical protein